MYPHLVGRLIPTWLGEGCMYESLVLGRSLMMYRVVFFLVEHLFADLAFSQEEHEQHTSAVQRLGMDRLVQFGIYKGGAHLEISAGTQGEYGQQNVYQGKRISWSTLFP